jgi:Transposase/zinc-finger of transposase IS204/IS1001/IS1096/IS1165
MESVTVWRGAVYRHVERPTPLGPVACPSCGTREVAFRSWRRRAVEHPDAEQPTYLVLKLGKYACRRPGCPRKYFTPEVAEAAPRARASRPLQRAAARLYRRGKAALRDVAGELRELWHTGTGKSSVLRWHRATLGADCPRPGRLPFSGVLCIDEVYDRVAGVRAPIFTCVDPIAGITVRIPVERADAEHLAAAMRRVRALGATPAVIVSDLWAAYPEALRRVWPRAERQLCWFHVMRWVTRKLSELLKRHGEALPEAERKELNRLRFLLLACPEKRAKLDARGRAALARAWGLIRGTVVEEAIRLRDDLRAVLNDSASRAAARGRFDDLRATWPERFRPRPWRPGEPPPEPAAAGEPEGATGLRAYLEQIMAFFVRHFERMIAYLGRPGVPRTGNHAERANRRYRAVARGRYGWGTPAGQQAMLTALQGFDSS